MQWDVVTLRKDDVISSSELLSSLRHVSFRYSLHHQGKRPIKAHISQGVESAYELEWTE